MSKNRIRAIADKIQYKKIRQVQVADFSFGDYLFLPMVLMHLAQTLVLTPANFLVWILALTVRLVFRLEWETLVELLVPRPHMAHTLGIRL